MSIAEIRFRQGLLSVVFAGTLAITGCASTGDKIIAEEPPGARDSVDAATVKNPRDDKSAVESINVVGDGDRVLIGMTAPAKYTVFKLSDPSNPNSTKLMIDMPGVNIGRVSSPIAVDNAYLKDITVQSYSVDKNAGKNIGRIVIVLKQGVDYEIKAGSNSLLVSLRKDDATHAVAAQGSPLIPDASAAQDNKKEENKIEVKKEEDKQEAAVAEVVAPAAPEPLKTVSAPVSLKKASSILRVESSTEGGNTVIKIVADGAVGDFNSFELSKPARVVVDVPDVENSTGKRAVKLNGGYIKAVRIGTHDGKARLVLDASKKALPPHSIYKTDDSIILTFGPKVVPAVYRAEVVRPAVAVKEAAAVMAEGSAVKNAAVAGTAVPAESISAEHTEVPAAPQAAQESPAVSKEAARPVEAPKPAEVARPADNGITIDRVDFKKVDGNSRLTVASSKETEYTVNESGDGATVVIDIKGATISNELSRTLDATKLKTPVQTISAYQESTAPVKDVRILIKLKDRTPYQVKAEGAVINVDFAAAPAPPAVEVANAAARSFEARKVEEARPMKEYAGKKIDLDMMDANVSDVLRLLAEVSNLNIIASDDVKGTISLRLKNVPWDQAFDIILRAKELDSIREGNVVRVAPASRIRLEKEAVLTSKKAQEKLEGLDTKFITVNYGTADDLVKQVKNVLSDRGVVISDKRTNTLIVTDIIKGIDAAADLVRRLDKQTPQVLIEARIVEASSNFARDLGIQWGLDYGAGGNVRTQILGSQGTTGQVDTSTQTSTSNSSITASGVDQYAVNLPATGTAGTLGALGFIFGKTGSNPFLLDLRLSAGESQGRLKTISRPRITTLDNKEAKIEQGESIPFETTSASGTSTTFVDASLSLIVTPHITPDGSVLMKIKATRNSIGTFRTASGQPSINKKESITEVLVQDGETTVIGGIVVSDKSETDQGIPYLKDLPVLGWLFKSKSVADQQQELLIFITPTIVKEKIVG